MSATQALYRFFAHDGSLLYVGITMDPGARWRQHRSDKPWWSQVGRIELETHPDRASVLAAEREAIIAERPLHNVIHNRASTSPRPTPPPAPIGAAVDAYDSAYNQWTFSNHRSGFTRTTDLYLCAEINGTPLTDDFTPDEISAADLMHMWMRRYGTQEPSIYWYLRPVHESAPFQDRDLDEDFLTFFSWPVNAYTGERINWNRMPVLETSWTDVGDKGGFFQEITGWKPSPMQPRVPLQQVLKQADLA